MKTMTPRPGVRLVLQRQVGAACVRRARGRGVQALWGLHAGLGGKESLPDRKGRRRASLVPGPAQANVAGPGGPSQETSGSGEGAGEVRGGAEHMVRWGVRLG